jgi:cysteinylglycine-S-conjugate dipeptidase
VGATPSVPPSARALGRVGGPPGTDAAEAGRLLTGHLTSRAPWGARVAVEQVGLGEPFRADTASPAYASMAAAMREAYDGAAMEIVGQGGSIPLANTLATLYPEAEILLIGLSEPAAQIHAPNENCRVEDFLRIVEFTVAWLKSYAEIDE